MRKSFQSPDRIKKNSSYCIAPAGNRTHDLPHTVASNTVKVSHTLNHSATVAVQSHVCTTSSECDLHLKQVIEILQVFSKSQHNVDTWIGDMTDGRHQRQHEGTPLNQIDGTPRCTCIFNVLVELNETMLNWLQYSPSRTEPSKWERCTLCL